MSLHLKGFQGCLLVLAVLVILAALVGYVTHSTLWAAVAPIALILVIVVIAALPIRKRMTPQQFAELLEPHLLGTDDAWSWDNATSIRLADERLEQLRLRLSKFDSLISEERRDELRKIIRALRQGEVPEVVDDDSTDTPRFRC